MRNRLVLLVLSVLCFMVAGGLAFAQGPTKSIPVTWVTGSPEDITAICDSLGQRHIDRTKNACAKVSRDLLGMVTACTIYTPAPDRDDTSFTYDSGDWQRVTHEMKHCFGVTHP